MKKIFFSLLLLFISLLAVGAGKETYYIVDGKSGVPFDQLPPAEEIDSRQELDPEEAEYIYGKHRAANGVVVICTKEYARERKLLAEHSKRELELSQKREEQARIRKETIAKQQALQLQEKQKTLKVIYTIVCVVSICLLFFLLKHSKSRYEEACRIAQHENSKRTIRSERFYVTDSVRFYATIIVWLIFTVLIGLALWWMYASNPEDIMYAIILLLIEPLPVFIIIESITYHWRCYTEIDDEGIRGVCAEYWLSAIPLCKGINIRWEQVASAKVIDVPWGRRTEDRLVFYSDEQCQNMIDSIFLMMLPTSEIKAQVNRFYSRYAGKRLIG